MLKIFTTKIGLSVVLNPETIQCIADQDGTRALILFKDGSKMYLAATTIEIYDAIIS